MSRLTSKTVLAATVAGLAVAGGGAAIAASQTDSQGSSFLDSVAKHLGISSEELEDATKAAAVDQVDQALADGKITQEQADALKERIESGEAPFFLGPGMFGFRHGFGGPGDNGGRFGGPGHHFFFGDKLGSAAEYLGLTEDELHEQLRAGKSLADVAEAEGKSVDGLKQAILDGARSGLDEAVANERLTQEQADAIYERLQSAIDNIVNGTFPGPGGRGFGPRFGGPPGTTPPRRRQRQRRRHVRRHLGHRGVAAAPTLLPSAKRPAHAGLFHISTRVRGSHGPGSGPGRGRRGRCGACAAGFRALGHGRERLGKAGKREGPGLARPLACTAIAGAT